MLPVSLSRQLAFVRELDRLKGVVRRTSLIDRSRLENTAEHSWHLAAMALALGEHAPPGTDLGHVIELLLVHDIVEIDAGDICEGGFHGRWALGSWLLALGSWLLLQYTDFGK